MKPIVWMIVAVLGATILLFANRKFAAPEPGKDVLARTRTNVSPNEQSLDERRAILLARLLEKEQTARALLRKEITLDQAAERFRALIRDDPAAVESLERWFGTTGDEVYYRNVLKFARGAAFGEPPEILAVLEGLEDELRCRFPPRDSANSARP